MLRLTNIKLELGHDSRKLTLKAARALHIHPASIQKIQVVKKAVDARNKQCIRFVYTVDVAVDGGDEKYLGIKNVSKAVDTVYSIRRVKPRVLRPVVVGSGPAGLCAALILSEAGLAPIVIERGRAVEERTRDVENFWNTSVLDENSNVQFGEGGAGTFSDGKLTTGTHDPRIKKVLEAFAAAGAPEEIRYEAKPHIGTDKLVTMVANLRQQIISLGGEFLFSTKLTGFKSENNKLSSLIITDVATGGARELAADCCILAIGHSARDTFEMLHNKGVMMAPKPFSVGVRIEHPQQAIDKSQYGDFAGHPALGAADYKLNVKLDNGRGIYTFCMCPGGKVVAAASEKGGVVTNGMSSYNRDEDNANSALLVSVSPEDFPHGGPLGGIEFQREIERAAFRQGGGNYFAPAQRVGDFLEERPSKGPGKITPSYTPGVVYGDLRQCLPGFVSDAIAAALPLFDRKLKGFGDPEAVLTGVETRSSSPVRILRNDLGHANIAGIFPCGEGAGYAGGIVSAAVDGIKSAEMVLDAVIEA